MVNKDREKILIFLVWTIVGFVAFALTYISIRGRYGGLPGGEIGLIVIPHIIWFGIQKYRRYKIRQKRRCCRTSKSKIINKEKQQKKGAQYVD